MSTFLAALLVGLGNGAVIALIALGFVVIYKSTQIVSLAQPALMILGAFIVSLLSTSVGMSFYSAVGLSVLATAAVGVVLERLTLRPLIGEPVFIATIVTVGLDIVLRSVVNRQIGGFSRQMGDPWGLSRVDLGVTTTEVRYLVMLGVSAVVVALLFAFFRYSRMGLAMRATSLDQEVAMSNGVSVSTVFILSWALAGGLAALGGAFVGTGTGIDQASYMVAFKAIPAVVLGGLDSLWGAVIGGLAVGVLEALVATYQGGQPGQCCAWLGTGFSTISPFALLLVVLLIRPFGLFGTHDVERV